MIHVGNMNPGVTPAQGRVVFHMERLFRSTGGGMKAHASFTASCFAEGLPPLVSTWTREQCVLGLQLIERACRFHKLQLFRDIRTDWEDFV